MELNDTNLNEDGLSRAATWFAGYAVMRWHLGYELGDLFMAPDGTGEWLAPERPPLVPAGMFDDIKVVEAPRTPEGRLDLEAFKLPRALEEEILGNLHAMQQAAPRPYELVIMDLAARVGEYGETIPGDMNAWPPPWLDNAREFFTPAYCQSAFDRPMQYHEAVLYCLEQAKTVIDQYAALHWRLAYELFRRFMRGELEMSGPEITDLLHQWRADTALP
jgi:hypothetical protein